MHEKCIKISLHGIFPGTTAIKKKAVDVSVCLTDSKYLHKFKRYAI